MQISKHKGEEGGTVTFCNIRVDPEKYTDYSVKEDGEYQRLEIDKCNHICNSYNCNQAKKSKIYTI